MGLARYDYHRRGTFGCQPDPRRRREPVDLRDDAGALRARPGYGTTSMFTRGMIYTYGCSYSPVWQLSCRVARVSPSAAATPSS